MDEAVDTLKRRLASGEIDIIEYENLLRLITRADTQSEKSPRSSAAESLVARFEDFLLFEGFLQVGDKRHPLADAMVVTAYAREISFNFIKGLESGFTINFQGDAAYSASHDSTWPLKKERYNQLREFAAKLKAATAQSRMNNAVNELRQFGRILIGHSNKKEPQIYLTVEGRITTAIREFDIRSCAATGTFGVGVVSINSYNSPNTVLISNGKKPLLGYGKESLSFDLGANEDVLKSLLLWIANPKNSLR